MTACHIKGTLLTHAGQWLPVTTSCTYVAAGVSCDGSTSFTSIQAFDLSQPEKDAVVLQEGLCASEFGM